MKGLFLTLIGFLIYLRLSAAQVSFRLQAPPPSPQQQPRSKFNFGRLQPMVNAIFSRNNRFRRPLLHHHPVDPVPFHTKPPPLPVRKPPFHTFEQNLNLPKRVPTVPLPPPPPPRHLLPEESLAYLQDGFGPPRPNSIIFTSSNLENGNLELVPELKPLEANDVINVSIQDTIFPHLLTETDSNSDQFFPVIEPLLQPNDNQNNIEQQNEGKRLSSSLISLNSVQLNPEAVFHFVDHQPTFFEAEPLKPSTIIQPPQINNDDSSLDRPTSNIKGLRPPPFERGNAGSFQGNQFPAFAPESQISSVSEQQETDTLFPLHELVDNDVSLVFPNTFTATNAGILPLANELPEVEQRFPPFI